jgi:hypothetical protein
MGQAGIYQTNATQTIASNKWETYNGGGTEMNFSYPASGAVNFQNGSTRLYINSSGNVGIGTPTPASEFHIYRPTPYIRFTDSSATGNNGNVYLYAIKDGVGYNNMTTVAYTHTWKGGGSETTFMSLNSAGLLNIGPATGVGGGPGISRINVVGAISTGENTNGTAVIDAFSSYAYYGCNGSTYAIWIGPSGLVYNYSNSTTFNTSSDIRVKQNIVTLPNALDTIAQLNPVTFDYNQDFADHRSWDNTQKNNNIGFIAQEFETVFPKYVHTVEEVINGETVEDFKTIDTGHLVPVLVKAIQEQQSQIEILKQQVQTLLNKQ